MEKVSGMKHFELLSGCWRVYVFTETEAEKEGGRSGENKNCKGEEDRIQQIERVRKKRRGERA